MATKPEQTVVASPLDTLKLLLGVIVLIAGIVGYYYFEQESQLLRVIGVLVAVILAIVLFMQTQKGQDLWAFIQGSRIELRKVVWPTRQEATQTTIAVIGFTLILGIFFWLLDKVLFWATRGITGLGS